MELKIAVVCSSNQNRSMEAHKFLSKKGFNVKSYGAGNQVKLPGSAPNQPNVYSFQTTYDEMYKDLLRKDRLLSQQVISIRLGFYDYVFVEFYDVLNIVQILMRIHQKRSAECFPYTQNGILHMLDRNRRIKSRPERFQDTQETFDIVITAEERVYDQVVESLESRQPETYSPVHIINIDIQDNHEEATLGAFLVCSLCEQINNAEDRECEIEDILERFQAKNGSRNVLHTVAFY